ncbi:predicted protein [Uncinocarpus reesii 1704]|uniref:Uncharacterized protein n=1 Tax=Uncinocarpus reesii (strain UAMH 1704) TaxID=336963 RepID=C4JUK8_UNCRE|nr:uncharacterized protein UREG_04811 [Uncinocarpus reesii 1704]EEP79969.1 predicted protein [Uncinocarpus reesii 1704]
MICRNHKKFMKFLAWSQIHEAAMQLQQTADTPAMSEVPPEDHISLKLNTFVNLDDAEEAYNSADSVISNISDVDSELEDTRVDDIIKEVLTHMLSDIDESNEDENITYNPVLTDIADRQLIESGILNMEDNTFQVVPHMRTREHESLSHFVIALKLWCEQSEISCQQY